MNNYKQIYEIINQNCDNNNWFTFNKKFEKEGKQGIVGLIKVKNLMLFIKRLVILIFK